MAKEKHFSRLGYLGSAVEIPGATAAIVGLPFDGTSSWQPGSRFAPDAIRRASQFGLETWDPALEMDLADYRYADAGDLQLEPGGGPEEFLETARNALSTLPNSLPLIGLGGEHTVSLPLVERTLRTHPDLAVLVFDAHTDLRDSYAGSRWSHACCVRRIVDMVGPARVAMLAVRSGTREEFAFAEKQAMLFPADDDGLTAVLERIGGRPVYISLDLDGFDPKELPGTGTPEAGGFGWSFFLEAVLRLKQREVVGADVVELLPSVDPGRRSEVLAAKAARALLLLLLNSVDYRSTFS